MSNPTGQDLFRKGISLFKSGNFQEASTIFLQILDIDEKNHKAWNALGVVYTSLGNYSQADVCYEKALALAPETAPYQRNLERNRANIELKENQLFEDVTENPDTWYENGQQLWEQNNFEEAIVAFDHAIKDIVEHNSRLYQKGLEYDGLKNYDIRDESLKSLDQAINNIRQCYSLLHRKGEGLFNLGRFEEAIEVFDQAIKLNMELAWVNYSQGAILSLLPKTEEGPEEGIKVFNNAHESFQDLEKTFYLKGLALGRLGRYEEAIAAINQAIKIDPNYADAIRSEDG